MLSDAGIDDSMVLPGEEVGEFEEEEPGVLFFVGNFSFLVHSTSVRDVTRTIIMMASSFVHVP